MREKHELEKGIICEKCLKIAEKGNYTRIQFIQPVVTDTTGLTKTIARINFCNDCFNEYKKVTESFMGREFIEYENKSEKIDKLSKLRDELLASKDNCSNEIKK